MSYGITDQGFVAKRLADIKAEIEQSLRDAYGDNINLLPTSVLGQLVGIFSERESKLWELAEGVYNSQYPRLSSGVPLDNVVSLTGITRQAGTKSTVDLTMLGDVGTIIPAGSVFSVAGDTTARFVLLADATITAGQDEIQKLSFSAVPDAGNFKLSYDGNLTTSLAFNSISQDIEDALNALTGLSSVSVAGDFSVGFTITFTGADGLKDHPLLVVSDNTLEESTNPVTTSVVVNDEGFPNRAIQQVEAEEVGPTAAPSGSLTVIENPVSGLDSVTNALDAELGRNIETDTELKIRREQSLQRAGAAVLGAIASQVADLESVLAVVAFENITFLTDGDGRPPKSFEIVVDGGDDQAIADKIWDTKPAGIESHGTTTITVTDSQGFLHNVKFSRPIDINIYLEIDLTTNADFPDDGLTQVENALLAHGNALTIGEDVIVYPKLLCALNTINGIIDVAIRIGTTASPTTDDNIPIAANEKSKWDSSRITVVEL